MAKCAICEKSLKFGNNVSHSHHKTNRTIKPNLKHVTIKTDKGNKKEYVCTRCLRSASKTGLIERA